MKESHELLFHLKQNPWNINFVLVISEAYHQTFRRANHFVWYSVKLNLTVSEYLGS